MILSLKTVERPSGVSVVVPPVLARRDVSDEWATAIFTVLASVPASVLAGWLLKVLTDKKSTVVTINRKEVHLEEGEIVRVIEETKRLEQ